jgi:hypothetical protein
MQQLMAQMAQAQQAQQGPGSEQPGAGPPAQRGPLPPQLAMLASLPNAEALLAGLQVSGAGALLQR